MAPRIAGSCKGPVQKCARAVDFLMLACCVSLQLAPLAVAPLIYNHEPTVRLREKGPAVTH